MNSVQTVKTVKAGDTVDKKRKPKYTIHVSSEVTLTMLECTRCGYKWFPRTLTLPEACARCRSPYWNKPRVRNIKKQAKKR